MRIKEITASLAIAYCLAFTGAVQAQESSNEPVRRAEVTAPQPYKLSRGTFINLTLESINPDRVSAIISQNVYDEFENIAIPKGSRVFGRQVNQVNNLHNVLWTEIQLSDTGQTYTLEPPLQAATPLGSAGLVDFKLAARAGTMLSTDLIFTHEQ